MQNDMRRRHLIQLEVAETAFFRTHASGIRILVHRPPLRFGVSVSPDPELEILCRSCSL